MSYVEGWLGELMEWRAVEEDAAERAAGLILKAQTEAEDRAYQDIEKWFREQGIDSAADAVNCLHAAKVLPRVRVTMIADEKRNQRVRAEWAKVATEPPE